MIPALANARRNVVISHNEKDTVVPGLDIVDGVVTPKTAVPVLDYYHSHMEFTERMPVVIDGKTYNEIYTGLTLQLGPVEVPTNVEDLFN